MAPSMQRALELPIAALPVLGFYLPLRPLSLSACCDCFKNQRIQPLLFARLHCAISDMLLA
jgi:hypothetical protein